jgi:PKD repeat protein
MKNRKYSYTEHPNNNELHNSFIIYLITVFTFILGTSSTITAATDFQGRLNSITITDYAKANEPPVVNFTHTKDGDIFSFNAGDSYDPDGEIVEYRWDFGDGNIQNTSTAQFSSTSLFTVQLTVVDNTSGISVRAEEIVPTEPFKLAVSFQPNNVEVEDGFVIDSGLSFDSNTGYGWTILPQADGTRDRNSAESPNQSYDTMIHVRDIAKWEINVPNGQYQVIVCMGDASFPIGTIHLQLNEVQLFNGEALSTTQKWIEKTTELDVTSSKIVLTFIGSSHPARLSWLSIISK